jgi:oligoribonuclease
MAQNSSHLIWLDLEMTGLELYQDKIIEIATLVTDVHLNVIEEGPILAIHQSDERLSAMNEWCTTQHGQSGLTERVRQSNIDIKTAERLTLAFLQQHVPANTSPLCGNSIGQDRLFLYHYMPDLERYFHYRLIDVSTLKELARRWLPKLAKFEKDSKHLAMNDIHDSIEELKYYREHFLRLM